MRRSRIVLALSVISGATVALGAPQGLTLAGHIHVAGDSGRTVADAEVALLPGLRTVRSDSTGAFAFRQLRAGSYTLRVRKVGFEPQLADVVLKAESHSTDVTVSLRTGAQMLAEVVVSGRRVMFPARLAEPYTRVTRGRGTFFVRELIDSLQPWDVSSLLVRVPGVRVNDRGVQIGRCVGHGASPAEPGKLHLFLDGVRQTSYNTYLSHGVIDALRGVAIASVQLIEVHTSINTIPPEYADDACAVILIWSR